MSDTAEIDVPVLGQRVAFTHVLGRDSHVVEGQGFVRRWDAYAHEGEGVVYGIRTLSNGTVEAVTESDGYGGYIYTHNEYRPREHFTAYLISTHLRYKPVVVKADHARVIPPGVDQ